MDIEDEFELSVPDDEVDGLQTVGDVVQYLLRRLERDDTEEPSASVN
jgi:acyl carrier protein